MNPYPSSRRWNFLALPAALAPFFLGASPAIAEDSTKVPGRPGIRANADPAHPSWDLLLSNNLIGTYHADLKGTPGIYPLLSPKGRPLTRRFPIGPATETERDDHDHHRSLWFTHGEVTNTTSGKVDFWLDDPSPHTGIVRQTGARIEESDHGPKLITQNEWRDAQGRLMLTDTRWLHVQNIAGDTAMDFTVRLQAASETAFLGDTKEGTFGIRVGGAMKVDAKRGGTIHNAEGLTGKAAWSKASAWVDYSGPVPAAPDQLDASETTETAGITMMYHPQNSLQPCRWHVRTYGLFAANPFGRKHFGLEPYKGYPLEPGEPLTLRFRMVLHDGGFDDEKAALHYAKFAAEASGG
ncbi:MAG: PmoA family protein [Planctomycetota bacterium]